MHTYIERWPELKDFIDEIDERIKKAHRPADELILDDTELCSLLHMSKRTSASIRHQKLLPYHKVGGKIYYLYSDVLIFLKKNRVEAGLQTYKSSPE